ncbi:MAG TPA: peptidase [Mycobacteriales bacterium]|nr:peptidase [Mycobacteriales bacterium]
MRSASSRSRRLLVGVLLAVTVPLATVAAATSRSAPYVPVAKTDTLRDALARKATPGEIVPAALAPRRSTPEDRYAMAGGCYVVRSVATGKYVGRNETTFAAIAGVPAAAERFRFQAIDLGKYLLYAGRTDFLSADRGPNPDGVRPATELAQGYAEGVGDENLDPARSPVIGAIDVVENGADPIARLGGGSDAVVAAATPSGAAEWVVRPAGRGRYTFQLAVDDHDPANPGPLNPPLEKTLTATSAGRLVVVPGEDRSTAAQFTLTLAQGCATWPEIETNVTGPHAVGSSPYAETKGYFDGHLHLMGFEFLGGRVICGRPWHPYGVQHALVDCPDHSAGGGYGAVLEQFLSERPGGHDTVGWPTFREWPRYNSLTHQQGYYKWIERAWRGGLRMYTNLLVENGVLCEAYPLKKNSCNEMDSVRLPAQRLRELERYIDAQYGGPGEGWFRIVLDPFQARRVVNAGKLAVVMGIEVSVPLDCGEILEVPRCNEEDVAVRLHDVYELGVRQMELTNKFDNAFTGVTGDNGAFGVLVSQVGNRYETGHTFKMGPCNEAPGHKDHEHRHDKHMENLPDATGAPIGRDDIFGAVLHAAGQSGVTPVYGAGPHCNVIGLTDLGRKAIDGLMQRGMLFDPDHMSAIARKAAMEHVAKAKYSGVISSHSWGDLPTYREILRLGGAISISDGSSTNFVKDWRELRQFKDPRYVFGIGFGSDITGFSSQGPPRNPAEKDDVDYPFRGLGGAIINKQKSGERVYDVNTDGVHHYGLYPDWFEDARLVAGRDGPAFKKSVESSVEAFLQTWERAVGVPGNACRADVLDLDGAALQKVGVGTPVEHVLVALGQPKTREGRTMTFCAKGGEVAVRLDKSGRVSSVSSARR